MEVIGSTGADVRLSDNATTRAIAWLTAWDSQGVHRTATSGDEAGADWLIRESHRYWCRTRSREVCAGSPRSD
jgi:hypothetical protein